jgi:hypothetical protein
LWNNRHGLMGQSILRAWCGGDWSRWRPHVMPLGDGDAGAPLLASGHVEIIGGVLEDGT